MSLAEFTPNHEKNANLFIMQVSLLLRVGFPDLMGKAENFTSLMIQDANELREMNLEYDPELRYINETLIRGGDLVDIQSADETEVAVTFGGRNLERVGQALVQIKGLAKKFDAEKKMETVASSGEGDIPDEVLKGLGAKELAGALLIYIFR